MYIWNVSSDSERRGCSFCLWVQTGVEWKLIPRASHVLSRSMPHGNDNVSSAASLRNIGLLSLTFYLKNKKSVLVCSCCKKRLLIISFYIHFSGNLWKFIQELVLEAPLDCYDWVMNCLLKCTNVTINKGTINFIIIFNR